MPVKRHVNVPADECWSRRGESPEATPDSFFIVIFIITDYLSDFIEQETFVMFEFFMGTMFPAKLKTQKITSYQEDCRFTDSLEDSPYLLKINSEQCKIKSTNFNYRKIVSIPLFFVVVVTSIFSVYFFINDHIRTYRQFYSEVSMYERIYAETSVISEPAEQYLPFFNKEPNLFDYLTSFYSGDFYVGADYSIYLTILLAFGFGYCLYITGKSAFFGPYPILVLGCVP